MFVLPFLSIRQLHVFDFPADIVLAKWGLLLKHFFPFRVDPNDNECNEETIKLLPFTVPIHQKCPISHMNLSRFDNEESVPLSVI